jgi:hypothetical protein
MARNKINVRGFTFNMNVLEQNLYSQVRDIYLSIPETLLRALSPENMVLKLDSEARVMALLQTQIPQTLTLQQFTRNEWAFFGTLLRCFPYYAPYEMLLADLTSLSCDDCRSRLLEIQSQGAKAVGRELKPIYRALYGVRIKLHKICPHIKISLVRDSGYVLIVLTNQHAMFAEDV